MLKATGNRKSPGAERAKIDPGFFPPGERERRKAIRTKIKKWLVLMGFLGMAFVLSGCFYTEQKMVIDPEGKADISVTFWFDKTFAGNEGAMAVQGLLWAFPELQTNYEIVEGEEGGDLGYTFRAKQQTDINQNRYISFTKREDGSYSFVAEIPKSVQEESEQNRKVLVVKVSLPGEVEIANSLNYEDRTVEWELRENDFTRDIILKAFTKTTAQQIQSLRYLHPVDLAIAFVEAVEQGNLELAYEFWYDKTSAKEAIRNLIEKEQNWGNWEPVLKGYHVKKINPDKYSISVPFANSKLSVYHIHRVNDRWLIISQNFMDYAKPPTNEVTTERTPDFSSPEQTVRTLIEAVAFGNEDAACDCFSFYLPPHLVGIFIQRFIDGFSKALGEKQGIERETVVLNMVDALSFEKERIDDSNFYVWVVNLDAGKRINEAYFRVELEDQEWKVFNPEGSEEQWFEIEKLFCE